MRLVTKTVVALLVVGTVAGLSVDGQTVGRSAAGSLSFTRITTQEINALVADVAEINPMSLKRFEDPKIRHEQIDSLRKLLAFASEAQRTGLASDRHYQNELETIRSEVIAVTYDKYLNKGKPERGPFGYITDAAMAAYWGESAGSSSSAALKAERESKFERFLDTKIYFLRETNPQSIGRKMGPEERAQARDTFVKIEIYAGEYAKRTHLLPLAFRRRVDVQVKLQQAQYLARLYHEKVLAKVVVSDEEIADYLKAHPELDPSAKRATAEKILARAKSGEDFAKLANEFTEDPGNGNDQGQRQGGLYSGVGKGVMVAPFERGALALEPGQVSPELVETDFGFHILKLERKNVSPGETYDVRHILIATGVSDPSSPAARPVPVKEYAKRNVEIAKEKSIVDRIVVENKISVPEDFVLPTAAVPQATKAKARSKKRPARKRT